jgi:uncharacterized protein YfiM (DUF2279 family)
MVGLTLLLTLHLAGPVRSTDQWFSSDKAKHFITSAFVESLSFSALRTARVSKTRALVGASIAAGTIGAGKELYDRRFGGDPSLKDLAADGAGMLAAALILAKTMP